MLAQGPIALGVLGLAQAVFGGEFKTLIRVQVFREQMAAQEAERLSVQETKPVHPQESSLLVPVDHFHNESDGPVVVLQGGEADGAGHLPDLQKGIVAILCEATGGLGVVLEHRYYGESWPTANLSAQSLRFLTTQQALADMAYFAQNVVFPGYESTNLTSSTTTYIAYGGSYAGAFVAFLQKLYPDVYWGAISSSGVTEAIVDYWRYFEAHRRYAPAACVTATQSLIHIVDNILIGEASNTTLTAQLKSVFGLEALESNGDFAGVLSMGIRAMQNLNWNPAINDTIFGEYCNNISTFDAILWPDTRGLEAQARSLVLAGDHAAGQDILMPQMLNFIGYVNATSVQPCLAGNETIRQCFDSFIATFHHQYDDLSQTWRSWPWQFCTQWGFFMTGTGVPEDQLPLVSRTIDLDYASVVCREVFGIYDPPDVLSINQYGGHSISYPRLAIIDGERDPWRDATPHAVGQPMRPDTMEEPLILIPDAVHHWDENGVSPSETTATLPPPAVADVQRREKEFVMAWMEEWRRSSGWLDGGNNDRIIGDMQYLLEQRGGGDRAAAVERILAT